MAIWLLKQIIRGEKKDENYTIHSREKGILLVKVRQLASKRIKEVKK